MPVPWITEYVLDGADPKWGDLSAPGGPVIACRCELGVGRATIGKQCPVRQRRAMTGRRCNVCGQVIDTDAIFVGISLTAALPDRQVTPVSMEAPTHPRCLAYSALTCPAIGGHHAANCALGITSGDYALIDRWVIRNPNRPDQIGEGFVPHDTPRTLLGQPVGVLDFVFARLDVPGIRFITLAEWMPLHAPKPYRRLWREQRYGTP